jgi:hypothetical protein
MATLAAASSRGITHVVAAATAVVAVEFGRAIRKDLRASITLTGALVRGVAKRLSATLADFWASLVRGTRAAVPAGIYFVLKESRLFSVLREIRGIVVTKESRGLAAVHESGQFIVTKEDRNFDVESH